MVPLSLLLVVCLHLFPTGISCFSLGGSKPSIIDVETLYEARPIVAHSLKSPFLLVRGTLPYWTFGGSTVISDDLVRLTPAERSMKGYLWNQKMVTVENWEVEIEFKMWSYGSIGADGMAFWYTQQSYAGIEGPVFGGPASWNGLAVVMDSFDNNGEGDNPSIGVFMNDGSWEYNSAQDAKGQSLANCKHLYRNYDMFVKIQYFDGNLQILTKTPGIRNEYEYCARVSINLPSRYYLGLTAATGGVVDNHDVKGFQFRRLMSLRQGQENNGNENVVEKNAPPKVAIEQDQQQLGEAETDRVQKLLNTLRDLKKDSAAIPNEGEPVEQLQPPQNQQPPQQPPQQQPPQQQPPQQQQYQQPQQQHQQPPQQQYQQPPQQQYQQQPPQGQQPPQQQYQQQPPQQQYQQQPPQQYQQQPPQQQYQQQPPQQQYQQPPPQQYQQQPPQQQYQQQPPQQQYQQPPPQYQQQAPQGNVDMAALSNDVRNLQALQATLEESVKSLQTSILEVVQKAEANTLSLASILKKQESFADSIENMLQVRVDPENSNSQELVQTMHAMESEINQIKGMIQSKASFSENTARSLEEIFRSVTDLKSKVDDTKAAQEKLSINMRKNKEVIEGAVSSSSSWGFWTYFILFQITFGVAFLWWRKYRAETDKKLF